jgi:hypothetical protein
MIDQVAGLSGVASRLVREQVGAIECSVGSGLAWCAGCCSAAALWRTPRAAAAAALVVLVEVRDEAGRVEPAAELPDRAKRGGARTRLADGGGACMSMS